MDIHVVQILIEIIVFLFAISVHESAHAWMALRNGDPTAYMLGRVTLNPIKHIDPVGTILLPALALFTNFPMVGWAKPTPVNTRNFKNLVKSDVMTSVAGPVSNFLVAFVAVLLLAIIAVTSGEGHNVVQELARGVVPGSGSVLAPLGIILYETMLINVLLAIFNLIPIPPLDGSHVLRHFLPMTMLRVYDTAGILALILLFLFGGGLLRVLFVPVIAAFNSFLVRL
jgi:Zn-dependent protease